MIDEEDNNDNDEDNDNDEILSDNYYSPIEGENDQMNDNQTENDSTVDSDSVSIVSTNDDYNWIETDADYHWVEQACWFFFHAAYVLHYVDLLEKMGCCGNDGS